MQSTYDMLPIADFSKEVLSVSTERLAVASLGDIGWSDLGDPRRLITTLFKSASKAHGSHPDRATIAVLPWALPGKPEQAPEYLDSAREGASDKATLHSMEHRLQAIMRAELLVNRMEVIPQSWQSDSQFLCHLP
jgi:hypothetical protein